MAGTTDATTPGSQGSPYAGSANSSTLSEYAGPYVTNMLGQAQALSQQPYQTYQGPLTAGPSDLQQNLFQGLGGINITQNYGQSISNQGAYTFPGMNVPSQTSLTGQANQTGQGIGSLGTNSATLGGSNANTTGTGTMGQQQGSSLINQYMNPYLQASLQPQLDALTRQQQMNTQGDLSKLTQAGGYGGSRQAVMQGANNYNLLAQQAGLIGTGYNTAYNNAQNQFNTEQTQGQNLTNTLAGIGGQQQAINQAGVTADYNEFAQQRDYPQKQLQFQQSMLQGLPLSTVYNVPQSSTPAQNLVGGLTGINTLLQNLGVIPKPATSTGTTP
jgi:hypothetical protein